MLSNSQNSFCIKADNLGKDYKLYSKPSDRLNEIIFNKISHLFKIKKRQLHQNFSALKDINFTLNKGEVLGILGRNGSGKSTLLQLISGILDPSHGTVVVNGKVSALLELGSGLNPNFTGRENIFHLAAIQGLSRKETLRSIDEIIEFADIGLFIDEQVGKFSTGMIMRLAFSVNTILKPEILIIDEALAVGDIPFQAKCFKKLRELVSNGVTIVFVSHDISSVKSICDKSIWLKDGHIELMGDASKVADEYEKFCFKEQGVTYEKNESDLIEDHEDQINVKSASIEEIGSQSLNNETNNYFKSSESFGSKNVEIIDFRVTNKHNKIIQECKFNEEVQCIFHLKLHKSLNEAFMIGMRFKDLKGNFHLSINDYKNIHFLNGSIGSEYKVYFDTKLPLHHDTYSILIGIFSLNNMNLKDNYDNYDFTKAEVWDQIDDSYFLTVKPDKYPHAGPVQYFVKPVVKKIK